MSRAAAAILLLSAPAFAFPVPKEGRAKSVAGTQWSGPIKWTDFRLLTQILTFEDGGKVTMTYKQIPDTTYRGTWKQDGDKLRFELSDNSWYEATIRGDEFTGTAKNNSNMTATHSGTRQVPK